MLELTPDNLEAYLLARRWVAHGENVRVELLAGGVSNVVFRVETERSRFIVKQSRPRLRTRDAWFSDVSRIWREQEVMDALAPHLDAAAVPRILQVDRDNFAFAMSHAPDGAQVWKDQLLASRIDPLMGERVGSFLALLHQTSAERRDVFAAFADATIFEQLRVEPFYRRVSQRRPEVAAALALLIEEMLTRREALCHGDYTPKNMLVHGRGFMLVDYETAHLGDPAMDLGLCFAHLLLKAVRRPADAAALTALVEAAWSRYASLVAFAPPAELERRGSAHLGACLLARVDGASPVEYLAAESQRDLVRRLARAILLDRLSSWRDIALWVRTEVSRLAAD